MDTFESNKILGALLGSCLGLLAVHLAAGAIFAPAAVKKPGYEIAFLHHPGTEPETAKEAPEESIEKLLVGASVERGRTAAGVCLACHSFERGGPTRVGPNLWNIVDSPRASQSGYNYSAAMKAKGGKWTFEELNRFLANPRAYIPGTAMTFAGVDRARQRADVIDYLHSLSDSPVPLPKVADARSNTE
jgi:cytochrome c